MDQKPTCTKLNGPKDFEWTICMTESGRSARFQTGLSKDSKSSKVAVYGYSQVIISDTVGILNLAQTLGVNEGDELIINLFLYGSIFRDSFPFGGSGYKPQ